MRCRKIVVIETGLLRLARDESGGEPVNCPDGDRHRGGVSLGRALVRNVRTRASMKREKSKWRTHKDESTDTRPGGGSARRAMKPGNAGGAKELNCPVEGDGQLATGGAGV
jgi:hypothetical protein